jgi:hypothetical protein
VSGFIQIQSLEGYSTPTIRTEQWTAEAKKWLNTRSVLSHLYYHSVLTLCLAIFSNIFIQSFHMFLLLSPYIMKFNPFTINEILSGKCLSAKIHWNVRICEISSSHGGKYEDESLLGYNLHDYTALYPRMLSSVRILDVKAISHACTYNRFLFELENFNMYIQTLMS